MHIPFSKDRLLAESEACLLTRKTDKERVPDVIYSTRLPQQLGVSLPSCAGSTGRRCSVLLSNGWLLAASVCLVTAVSCVIKCTIQMLYSLSTCWCPTPDLPLNRRYGPVRQQQEQKLVKFFFFFFESYGKCSAPRQPPRSCML